jgi:hypothetical protein
MSVADLIVLTLAAGGVVDCWLNGSIFERPREALSGWTLFGCDYCLNFQAPIWVAVACYLPALLAGPPWDQVLRLPPYAAAAGYGAWLINEWRACRECDYARARRAAADMARYGGREDAAGPE